MYLATILTSVLIFEDAGIARLYQRRILIHAKVCPILYLRYYNLTTAVLLCGEHKIWITDLLVGANW